MSNRVTIFWEYNVYETGQKASVWLLPGASNPNKTLDQETTAVRVIGPVAYEIAQQVIIGLEQGLTAAGLLVVREVTLDD